ncbi:hypothetical protein E2320_000396 [Naja naja]|nr:hypothetical protein E2320_000396 [Naja naja]
MISWRLHQKGSDQTLWWKGVRVLLPGGRIFALCSPKPHNSVPCIQGTRAALVPSRIAFCNIQTKASFLVLGNHLGLLLVYHEPSLGETCQVDVPSEEHLPIQNLVCGNDITLVSLFGEENLEQTLWVKLYPSSKKRASSVGDTLSQLKFSLAHSTSTIRGFVLSSLPRVQRSGDTITKKQEVQSPHEFRFWGKIN